MIILEDAATTTLDMSLMWGWSLQIQSDGYQVPTLGVITDTDQNQNIWIWVSCVMNREENHSLCNRFVSSISLVFTRTSVWVSDGLMFWVRSIMRLIISVRGPASAYISLYPHDLSSLVTPSPALPSHFLYVITDNDTALLMPGCSWWWLDGVDAHIMYAIMPRQHSQPEPGHLLNVCPTICTFVSTARPGDRGPAIRITYLLTYVLLT